MFRLASEILWESLAGRRVGQAERFTLTQDVLQERHPFEQRRIIDQSGEVQVAEQMGSVALLVQIEKGRPWLRG